MTKSEIEEAVDKALTKLLERADFYEKSGGLDCEEAFKRAYNERDELPEEVEKRFEAINNGTERFIIDPRMRKRFDDEFEEALKAEERRLQWCDDLMQKFPERYWRYLRLGFEVEKITRELLEDDRRWEEAKRTPIDPNTFTDMFVRYLTHGPE